MITRREVLQVGAATWRSGRRGVFTRALAQARLTEANCSGSTRSATSRCCTSPIFTASSCRSISASPRSISASARRGPAAARHRQGFSEAFGIAERSAAAYALTDEDFAALAQSYGRIGGLDRLATVVKRVRAERGNDKVLLLDGGDTWQGSLGANRSKGQDMVDCMALLKPDAMTGHWEFTYGEARVKELIDGWAFRSSRSTCATPNGTSRCSTPMKMFEKGGVKIAVLGQAFPYQPVANPRWMIPKWSFGIREEDVRANVEKARKEGAQLVVLLSHNGFDVDRKLASRVAGIDVILTGHTHDAHAGGNHGRQDTADRVRQPRQVRVAPRSRCAGGAVKGFRYKLIPLFADAISAGCRDGGGGRQGARALRQELARVVGPGGVASLPARQFQRHLRRSDLRGAA